MAIKFCIVIVVMHHLKVGLHSERHIVKQFYYVNIIEYTYINLNGI